MVVFWFRRDLRWEDNAGLYAALTSGEKVLPIFIFDQEILKHLPKNDARVSFIHQALEKINAHFQKYNAALQVFHGKPCEVFKELIAKESISAVYTNHDYEPYARKRDLEIFKLLQKHDIGFKTCKDHVIFEKSEVVKEDGTPYVVFTPYSRKWKEVFKQTGLVHFASEKHLDALEKMESKFLSLEAIGFEATKIDLPNYNVTPNIIDQYEQTRNFPAIDGTSRLGVHLRFGTVSVRKMVEKALQSKNETFLNELIWREFFMQILWHFPHTFQKSFKSKYDFIIWENNEEHFKKWCEGKTGYPFVDAGMRELNATGHMHNRVRMIVASFLCKHLLIDWRWGEAYFAEKLLDYEMASNVGNWQWAAGSGVDAAPYFRIFNPSEQIKKFDKDYRYIKKWIPELETTYYPKPIVEHSFARERCLSRYKEAVG